MNKKLILTLVAVVFTANANAEGINLSPVVVTATRTEQNSFDLPVSIDLVDSETIQDGRMQFSIAESLSRVPGVVVPLEDNLLKMYKFHREVTAPALPLVFGE
jgi:iron complex outermembrane receptor protein